VVDVQKRTRDTIPPGGAPHSPIDDAARPTWRAELHRVAPPSFHPGASRRRDRTFSLSPRPVCQQRRDRLERHRGDDPPRAPGPGRWSIPGRPDQRGDGARGPSTTRSTRSSRSTTDRICSSAVSRRRPRRRLLSPPRRTRCSRTLSRPCRQAFRSLARKACCSRSRRTTLPRSRRYPTRRSRPRESPRAKRRRRR
jgi:hypothetical protein